MKFYGKRHPVAAEYARYPVPLQAFRACGEDEAARAYAALKDPANVRAHGSRDRSYPSAVCYYGPPFLRGLADAIGEQVRAMLDFEIVETYWYARLYGTGDKLPIHTDRGSCFVSVSACFGYDGGGLLGADEAWPLGVLDDGGGTKAEREVLFRMKPGEAILYPGCGLPHWREPFLGQHCGQAFFHWVPKDDAVFGAFYGDPDKKG